MNLLQKIGRGLQRITLKRNPYDREAPVPIEDRIEQWTADSVQARDAYICALMGAKYDSANFSSMQDLVRNGIRAYLPRNWEMPPWNYIDGGSAEHQNLQYYFSVVENKIPVLMPGNVRVTAVPLSGKVRDFSTRASAVIEEEFQYLKMPYLLPMFIISALNIGSAVMYTGRGLRTSEVDIDRVAELCDPLAVLVDPYAKSLDDAEYVIYKRWRRIADVYAEYPNIKFEIIPDEIEEKFSTQLTIASSAGKSGASSRRCIETICFFRDRSVESFPLKNTVDVTDPISGEVIGERDEPIVVDGVPQMGERHRYPYGRLVHMVNDKIVYDRPNPYDHKHCPFIKLDCHKLPEFFWGLPEWYMTGDVLTLMNEAATKQVRDMRSDTVKTVIDKTRLLNPEETITNDPLDPIYVRDGDLDRAVKTVSIGGGSAASNRLLSDMSEVAQRITGQTNSYIGQTDANVTSGRQQKFLSEDSEKRNHTFLKNFESALEEIAYQTMSNAVQFRDDAQTYEIASNLDTPITFSIGDFKQNFIDRVQFKTKLIPNSGLPSDRQERFEQVVKIADVIEKHAGNPALVKIIIKLSDTPELEEYEQLIDQATQDQAALDAQAQMGQPTGNEPQTQQVQ